MNDDVEMTARAMSPVLPPLEPRSREVHLFWEEASKVVGLTDMDIYMGQNPTAAVEPPAWQFGDTAKLATELVELVVAGTKTATASVKAEYDAEGEPLPEVNSLGIVCDGAGRPRALVRTDAVAVMPFDDVPAEHAQAEGEGDRSLDFWRRAHVRFLPGFEGRDVDEPWPAGHPWPKDLMVLERITCIFPAEPKGFLDLF